jgi:hypothetical protein
MIDTRARHTLRSATFAVLLVSLAVASGLALAAAPGEVVNAELRHVRVDGDLAAQVARLADSSRSPVWVAWTVPVIDGPHSACCGAWRHGKTDGVCRLESRHNSWTHTDDVTTGGSSDLRVLLRLDDGEVDRVRALTTDCALDAGGLTFYEAEGVGANDSVAYLSSLVPLDRDPDDTPADAALMAIALHDGDAATRALNRFTEPPAHEELRAQGAFWLGVSRADVGFARLREMMRTDPSSEVKEQVIFAISQSEADGAMDLLVSIARDDDDPELRGQALFWLGQEAGERATATLKGAADNDPDADVREQAVFALSQLPPDEGIPLLIEFAKTSRHPEVRRSAMFWLGQSGDERALTLFEEILAR